MRSVVIRGLIATAALLALASFATRSEWMPGRDAIAGDAAHAASFCYSTEEETDTVLARLVSGDVDDMSASVTVYFTPRGGREQEFGGSSARRSATRGHWIEDEQAFSFTAPTSFRARFTTYDARGQVRWSCDRYLSP